MALAAPDDLLDHPLIGERYFYPRPAPPRSRLDVDAGDAVLACALHRADPDGHTVVHFHGNGEVVADWQGASTTRCGGWAGTCCWPSSAATAAPPESHSSAGCST